MGIATCDDVMLTVSIEEETKFYNLSAQIEENILVVDGGTVDPHLYEPQEVWICETMENKYSFYRSSEILGI